jgi:hypothetical protein
MSFPQNLRPNRIVSNLRLPQSGGPGSCIYFSPGTGIGRSVPIVAREQFKILFIFEGCILLRLLLQSFGDRYLSQQYFSNASTTTTTTTTTHM